MGSPECQVLTLFIQVETSSQVPFNWPSVKHLNSTQSLCANCVFFLLLFFVVILVLFGALLPSLSMFLASDSHLANQGACKRSTFVNLLGFMSKKKWCQSFPAGSHYLLIILAFIMKQRGIKKPAKRTEEQYRYVLWPARNWAAKMDQTETNVIKVDSII